VILNVLARHDHQKVEDIRERLRLFFSVGTKLMMMTAIEVLDALDFEETAALAQSATGMRGKERCALEEVRSSRVFTSFFPSFLIFFLLCS